MISSPELLMAFARRIDFFRHRHMVFEARIQAHSLVHHIVEVARDLGWGVSLTNHLEHGGQIAVVFDGVPRRCQLICVNRFSVLVLG